MKRIIVIALLIAAASPSVYFYQKYRAVQSQMAKGAAVNQNVKEIIAAVGKLIVVPQDEDPTVATVADKSKLAGQPFFANAENGDRVLMYIRERKAILYRPSVNKIIDVGPIAITQQATPSATPAAQVKFALYNGTAVTGLTRRYETELKSKLPAVAVVSRDNAAATGYRTTILVDVVGNKPSAAASLAQTLGIAVVAIPKGEATPSADFLVIVGEDKAK